MKTRSGMFVGLASLLLLHLLAACPDAVAQTNAGPMLKTNAPTGVYESHSAPIVNLVVRLETNGQYQVTSEETAPLGSQKQRGTWQWNASGREFLLTPATNDTSRFPYEFRRLRLDRQDTNVLQWLPLLGSGASSGAVDYIRLKRKVE